MIGMRLIHIPTGNVGVCIKEYKPTGGRYTIQIRMSDGHTYFAPYGEFRLYKTEKPKH
jgi:hypothetical protein